MTPALAWLLCACGQAATPGVAASDTPDGHVSHEMPWVDAAPEVAGPSPQKDSGSAPDVADVDAAGSERDAGSNDDAMGPLSAAGCPLGKYPVCLDFESGAIDAKWRMLGANMTVVTDMKAAGQRALHFSNLQPKVQAMITTTELGALTNVMWGRFYVHMTPGAPDGHGGFVYGYDQDGDRYEVGFENNCFMGDWHGTTPEKYMRTHVKIPDGWICVEFLFDGAAPDDPRIWVDGTPAPYYVVAKQPGPLKVDHWTRFDAGFRPSHGTSLGEYEGNAPPVITDMWMDDIALDSKRIGCEK